jgi:hypothetical protein
LTMVTENHPTSPSERKTRTTTTWMIACILGLTAAAAVSRAVLFVSRRESSYVLRATDRTEETFLLHRKDGTCVVQSGAWPYSTASHDDDDQVALFGPFATCFVSQGGVAASDYCWSRSYYDGDDWKPCKPQGYGSDGWTIYADCNDNDACVRNEFNGCGPPCTEFE